MADALAAARRGMERRGPQLFVMSLSTAQSPKKKGANPLKRLEGELRAFFTPLQPEVHVSTTRPYLGDAVAIHVKVPEPRTPFGHVHRTIMETIGGGVVRITEGGHEIKVFKKSPNIYRGFLPTTPLSAAGAREVRVAVRDGRHRDHAIPVEVVGRTFPTQSIWLEGDKEGLQGTDEEFDKVDALTATASPQQLWSGPFLKPTAGVMTTEYGVRRYYNGVFREDYFHKGVDYGCDEGTPVEAAGDGTVVLVGQEKEGFSIHGNCVGLDHGHGVTTIYMHLEDVKVAEGDAVRRGEMVGTVGNTGASTGPHLHWGLYVGGQCVDPHEWMGPSAGE